MATELRELVGTLNHSHQSFGDQRVVSLVTRHLADEQQRHVPQLHLLTRFDRKRGNLLRRDLRHQFGNAAGDLDAVLVELALPKQAGQHRAAQL
jgi:hypothetical protein